MIPYRLRPQAETDLVWIADFTLEKWGVTQEELYLLLLKQAFDSLSANPYCGRAMQDVLPGLRGLLAGSHLILYFVTDSHVDIVRVLHHSMDVARHVDRE